MADGDIGAAVDVLEFVDADIINPDMIHVSGNTYAIAYEDVDGDGRVVSIDIADDGQIGAAVIDSLEFDGVDGHEIKIIHVAGDVFAIAYRGATAHGFLVTVEITAAGEIGAAVIDSLEFDTAFCAEPDPIMVSAEVVAVVYRDAGNQGKIVTASISAAGDIGAAVIDSNNAWMGNVNNPNIVHVTGTVYAIVSRDNVNDGWVCTMTITEAGDISATVIDSLEYQASFATHPRMCKVSATIFAIAYRYSDNHGFLVTVEITAAGEIGAAVIDSLEFDVTACGWPDIIHIGNGIVAIAYSGAGDDGYIVTAQIDSNGDIGAGVIDSEEHDVINGLNPSIVHVAGNTYAIAYSGAGGDGFVDTPTIVTPADGRIKHLMMMGIG